MRREPEFFGDEELDLLYIAKKLDRALALERALTGAGFDYAVEIDQYVGGFLFRRERAGAFFYVRPAALEGALEVARAAGFSDTELLSHRSA